MHSVSEALGNGSCIQIHSDGGYIGKVGAAGVVIVRFALETDTWIPTALGFHGEYLPEGWSAFHAELQAAKIMISIALEIGRKRRQSGV